MFYFLEGKAPNEIHAILTETLACFLPGRAKDLSASLYSRSSASLCFVIYLNADGCLSKDDTVIDTGTPVLNPRNGCILLEIVL